MDKDFQDGTKASPSSENNNNITVAADQSRLLSSEDSCKNEQEAIISRGGVSKDSSSVPWCTVRVTASQSTIEHVAAKNGDSNTKITCCVGQSRSKTFLEQLSQTKGSSLMRVNFNGKKGAQGSHGDGVNTNSYTHKKGAVLNESLEKSEDQQKKQQILQSASSVNTTRVAQGLFDSSLSFADLVRACGQRPKTKRLHSVQLNNSLLSTPQSSTLVSNYFNKYRSYLDHLRNTYGHEEQDSGTPIIAPQVTSFCLPLLCMTPVLSEDIVQDPDYMQILEKTTTDSIRNLWSYKNQGRKTEAILLQCDRKENDIISVSEAHEKATNGQSFKLDDTSNTSDHKQQNTERCLSRDAFIRKAEPRPELNSRDNETIAHNADCMHDFVLKPLEAGSSSVTAVPEQLNGSQSDTKQNISKAMNNNTMPSLHPQHNGTAEWGDIERKPQNIGYSFRLQNQSAIDSLVQTQQRMAQQKQQERQQQDLSQTSESRTSQTLQNSNVGMNEIQGNGHVRHKICSRFQGMNVSSGASITPSSNQSRVTQPNSSSCQSGSVVNNNALGVSTSMAKGHGQRNGIYTMENLSSDDNNLPSMSGSMAYTRTLKASYACLDPNGAPPLSTKEYFEDFTYENNEELIHPNAFQQAQDTPGVFKWRDFQSRNMVLNRDKDSYGQTSDIPISTTDVSRTISGFSEPEPQYKWSLGNKVQRPIIKMNKDAGLEPFGNTLPSCVQKGDKTSMDLKGNSVSTDQSIGQKQWGGFSLPNSIASRLAVSQDGNDRFITPPTSGNSRLYHWRQDLSASDSLNGHGQESIPMTTLGGFADGAIGQRPNLFPNSSNPLVSSGNSFTTKSSLSSGVEVSPNKTTSRFTQAPHISVSGESFDGGYLQQSYQTSRSMDYRHKLFNNNNATSLFVNGKSKNQDDSSTYSTSEPWSNATCDDMTDYFDSSLHFQKSEIASNQTSAPTMTLDSNAGKGFNLNSESMGFSSHSSQNYLGDYNTPAFRSENSYSSLQLDRTLVNYTNQKEVPHSSASFSDLSSLQQHQQLDQKKKPDDFRPKSDERIFMPQDLDNKSLDVYNPMDMMTYDTNTLSPPWYELAPAPEETEEPNDKSNGQEDGVSSRNNQFRTNIASEMSNPLRQGFNSTTSSMQAMFGNQRIENKPRLILGANTINQRKNEEDRESLILESEKHRLLGTIGRENKDKLQPRKTLPFPFQTKQCCPSSSPLATNQFQTSQFQMAGINHQPQSGVPQQMYCIPNILMPPPPSQGQGRHPGVLSYTSPFPQGVMRVPLVDMSSRLVYVQSVPFNMATPNPIPNGNHNNSSSSNPHVNTSNIITINTAENDFSVTGEKGGTRPVKPAGIRAKSTLLKLRSNGTLNDVSFQGIRSSEDGLLSKGAKSRGSNGNPWDADLEHDFSSSLFSKVTTIDQSRLHPEFGLIYPDNPTANNNVTSDPNFRSSPAMSWPSTPDMHPEMLDMLPVRKQPIEDYGRQVCWPDMELVMSSTREQLQVVRKSNKPLGSNKANLISILPKSAPGDVAEGRGHESGFERVEI